MDSEHSNSQNFLVCTVTHFKLSFAIVIIPSIVAFHRRHFPCLWFILWFSQATCLIVNVYLQDWLSLHFKGSVPLLCIVIMYLFTYWNIEADCSSVIHKSWSIGTNRLYLKQWDRCLKKWTPCTLNETVFGGFDDTGKLPCLTAVRLYGRGSQTFQPVTPK